MMTKSTGQVFLPFRVLLIQSPHVKKINDQILSLETFAATEFKEMFSGKNTAPRYEGFRSFGY